MKKGARDDAGLESVPASALEVVRTLQTAGFEAYLVGGCVRDRFLARSVNDWDVATDAVPETVISLFERTIPTGLQHGTVTVMVGSTPIEVTTYRVEVGYSDGRRPDVVHYTRLLTDDLGRRDFTVNAMAWDPISGEVVDPYDGRGDLNRRLIRAVGTAQDRFDEDGLRALRAVRFACVLDFDIEPATWRAIPETMETFRRVSAERVRVEFMKIIDAPRVGWGVNALRECGLLGEFFPEVADIDHPAWAVVVSALADPPEARASRLAMVAHHAVGALEGRFRALRFSKAERRAVTHLLSFADVDPASLLDGPAVKGFVARVTRDAVAPLFDYRQAVDDAATGKAWAELASRVAALDALAAPLHPRELAIDGRVILETLGVEPSRRIGETLDILLREVWRRPEANTRAELLLRLPDAYARSAETAP